jgi:hypothetical protein
MSGKVISIMIVQMTGEECWHVAVFVDGESVECSPPIATRDEARAKAKIVARQFEQRMAEGLR